MIEDFLRPQSLKDALRLQNSDSFWYGGGTYINHTRSYSGQAISLELLGLDKIMEDQNFLVLGSMVNLQSLMDHASVPAVLKEAASFISSRNIRNMATIGGSLAVQAWDSYLIPVLVALDAEVQWADNSVLPLEACLNGRLDDLILSVRIPIRRQIARVRKVSRTSSSPSLVNIATVLNLEEDSSKLKSVRIVLNGITGCMTRLNEIESLVSSGELTDKDALEKAVAGVLDPEDDYRCTREYKIYISSVLVADCITESLENLV